MMATEPLLLLLVGGVALLALALCLWLLLVSRRQQKELQGLQQKLLALAEPAASVEKVTVNNSAAVTASPGAARFSVRLDAEERDQAPKVATVRNPAEKYGYVAAMAKQGMDAVQIAAALQMAPAEVEQLLRLASLKQGC